LAAQLGFGQEEVGKRAKGDRQPSRGPQCRHADESAAGL
jgi:hypothetical protein